jgi:hypothetical protein
MKKLQILQAFTVGAGMLAFQSQGALLITGQNPSSPYYADFSSSQLSISYTYSGGVGVFTATGTGDAYTSGSLSPGTHGAYNATGFTGSYSLTADIADVSGNWEVTGGSVTIDGALAGNGSSSDLLLSAQLKTGLNTFGYGATGTKEFDFLFTVTGGNSSILADFFGPNTGQGAIIFGTGAYKGGEAYNGDLTHGFANTGEGTADTFVPEPAAYPLAAAVAALLGAVLAGRIQPGTSALTKCRQTIATSAGAFS